MSSVETKCCRCSGTGRMTIEGCPWDAVPALYRWTLGWLAWWDFNMRGVGRLTPELQPYYSRWWFKYGPGAIDLPDDVREDHRIYGVEHLRATWEGLMARRWCRHSIGTDAGGFQDGWPIGTANSMLADEVWEKQCAEQKEKLKAWWPEAFGEKNGGT